MQRIIIPTIVLLVTLSTLTLAGPYSGGSGTPDDPYQIATAQDLIDLGNEPNDYDKHFIMTADIDLDPNLPDGKVFDQAIIAPSVIYHPRGFYLISGTSFTGHFDGNGHVLNNLNIFIYSKLRENKAAGLFGVITEQAVVRNLSLKNTNIDSSDDYVGSLVAYSKGTIDSCSHIGSVLGKDKVGGLVGHNHGRITSSYNRSTINGKSNVGGIAGTNIGQVNLSYSTGTVKSEEGGGGLVGYNEGTITSCYSTSDVFGQHSFMGGFGGLAGDNQGIIKSCYSIGTVTGEGNIGGLVGDNAWGTIISCFWDLNTSNMTHSKGGIALTTDEMMDPQMLGLNGLAEHPDWVLDPHKDYPRLKWQKTPGSLIPIPDVNWLDGSGTEEDPYQIQTKDQLRLLGKADGLMDGCFSLTQDLDVNDVIWSQAVIPHFRGRFDGHGYEIKNLTINGESNLGFFGQTDPNATIAFLGLGQADVNGLGDFVAGLVGNNRGTISSCYSSGHISCTKGDRSVGGLAGYNQGIIISCFTTGTTIGNSFVGGLVGENQGIITSSYSTNRVYRGRAYGGWGLGGLVGCNIGEITSCYSTGLVWGRHIIGGLVGFNLRGKITTCYSTGIVIGWEDVGGLIGISDPPIITSFWDTDTSKQDTSDGGTGLSTDAMQNINTYLDAGWDFVGETDNGTDDIWWIPEADYPRLWWEP